MRRIEIIGAGPAGSAAAISALGAGAQVKLFEKSLFPRHRVCGEFLSPEIGPLLERLGAWTLFESSNPARIRRMVLRFGTKTKTARLPEPAFGLSRYAFDDLLFRRSAGLGAEIVREVRTNPSPDSEATVWTVGRNSDRSPRRGRRLFGFKAHFTGPTDDAVELYFFRGCYVGINCVEDGITNVCGLGPENVLAEFGFEMDAILESCEALRVRTQSLRRMSKWLTVGPLVFRQKFSVPSGDRLYPAGDSLSFVDPFTGSGLAAALLTGRMAGEYAALGGSPAEYLRNCGRVLRKSFAVSSVLRLALDAGWAAPLAPWMPAKLLFRWTRPSLRSCEESRP